MSSESATRPVETENVVVSTAIDQELDLEALAGDLADTTYDPDQFPGITYQLEDPKATILLFRSGKLIGTGAESVEDGYAAIDRAAEVLRDLGLQVPDELDVEIQNIVSTADLGSSLNLNAIAIGFGLEHIEYEPEQFPGLVYRLPERDCVVLLFGSGKVVITGCETTDEATDAIDVVVEQLRDLDLLDA
jgi:transcription initiation factor TFIID TATA-box-binding protein